MQSIKAVAFRIDEVGKHVKGSKKRFSWDFVLNSKAHLLTLDFSYISGKVKVAVDNKILYENELPSSASFQYPFVLDGFSLNLLQQGEAFELRINNKVFSHLYNQHRTNTQFKKYQDQVKDIHTDNFAGDQKTFTVNIGSMKKKTTQANNNQDTWKGFGGEAFPNYFQNKPQDLPKIIVSQQPKQFNFLEDKPTESVKKQLQSNQVDFFSQTAQSVPKQTPIKKEEFSLESLLPPTNNPNPNIFNMDSHFMTSSPQQSNIASSFNTGLAPNFNTGLPPYNNVAGGLYNTAGGLPAQPFNFGVPFNPTASTSSPTTNPTPQFNLPSFNAPPQFNPPTQPHFNAGMQQFSTGQQYTGPIHQFNTGLPSNNFNFQLPTFSNQPINSNIANQPINSNIVNQPINSNIVNQPTASAINNVPSTIHFNTGLPTQSFHEAAFNTGIPQHNNFGTGLKFPVSNDSSFNFPPPQSKVAPQNDSFFKESPKSIVQPNSEDFTTLQMLYQTNQFNQKVMTSFQDSKPAVDFFEAAKTQTVAEKQVEQKKVDFFEL